MTPELLIAEAASKSRAHRAESICVWDCDRLKEKKNCKNDASTTVLIFTLA